MTVAVGNSGVAVAVGLQPVKIVENIKRMEMITRLKMIECASMLQFYPCFYYFWLYYNKQMLDIQFPAQEPLHLQYLVCDLNGTLTCDGKLIAGVQSILNELKNVLEIHLLSADTLGQADEIAAQLDVNLTRIALGNEGKQKAAFIRAIGARKVIALGQGANDALMLKQAALGICVLSPEGTAAAALVAADLVAPDILTALGLLQHPTRIVATLRK